MTFVVLLQELPAPILDDVAMHKPVEQPRLPCEPQDSLDAMKIAWRYQNLPKVQVNPFFKKSICPVIILFFS